MAATVGHRGAGTVPHHHVFVLPGSPRNYRGLRRDGQGVVQQCEAVATRDRQVIRVSFSDYFLCFVLCVCSLS